mgnify:CR=1 FL=1
MAVIGVKMDTQKEKIFQDILREFRDNSTTTKEQREDFTTWLYDYIYQLDLKV